MSSLSTRFILLALYYTSAEIEKEGGGRSFDDCPLAGEKGTPKGSADQKEGGREGRESLGVACRRRRPSFLDWLQGRPSTGKAPQPQPAPIPLWAHSGAQHFLVLDVRSVTVSN